MSEVTRILSAIEEGDSSAAEQLLPVVYDKLRRLAAQKLAHEKPDQTLQATALVHEAYLRLVDSEHTQRWDSRGHFFAAAAEAMRRILVESARRKQRLRHGGALRRTDLMAFDLASPQTADELVALSAWATSAQVESWPACVDSPRCDCQTTRLPLSFRHLPKLPPCKTAPGDHCTMHNVFRITPFLLGFLLSSSHVGAADGPSEPQGLVATLKGHTETVYAVAYSPDGRYVLTGSLDKTLKLWDAAAGTEIKTFGGQAGHQNLVLAAAFSPDGRMIGSGGSDNTAKIWDTPLKAPLRELVHRDEVDAVALSPDGTRLAAAGRDGTVKIWNTADGKQLFSLAGHVGPVTG